MPVALEQRDVDAGLDRCPPRRAESLVLIGRQRLEGELDRIAHDEIVARPDDRSRAVSVCRPAALVP